MQDLLKNNKVDALIPVYVDDIGNCTEIIVNGESYLKTTTIDTCIKNLADYYNISLYHNRVNYGKELGITNKVPIVISDELIYIYINVRKPKCGHDSAYGFIDVKAIDEIYEKNKNAVIHMKSGRIIETRQSVASLKKSILYARLIREIYKERHHKK